MSSFGNRKPSIYYFRPPFFRPPFFRPPFFRPPVLLSPVLSPPVLSPPIPSTPILSSPFFRPVISQGEITIFFPRQIMGVQSDMLFPVQQQRELEVLLKESGNSNHTDRNQNCFFVVNRKENFTKECNFFVKNYTTKLYTIYSQLGASHLFFIFHNVAG